MPQIDGRPTENPQKQISKDNYKDVIFFKPKKILRNLSMEYLYKGVPTSADPRQFSEEERLEREEAVLEYLKGTGYAETILEKRRSVALPNASQEYDTTLDSVKPTV